MKKRSVRLNSKGFTLVELLVVIAILALLAGIGVPQVMRTLRTSRQVADLTKIESIQAAFDAWRSEVGCDATMLATYFSTGAFTIDATSGTVNAASGEISLIDGEAVPLLSLIEGGVLPQIMSLGDPDNVTWHVNENGQIYVDGDDGQLPADASTTNPS